MPSHRPDPASLREPARHVSASGHEEKAGPIQLPAAFPLLHAIGLATAAGEIRADRRRKFNQINRFVELIAPMILSGPKRRLTFLDCGCGKSYLSFALNYYLHGKLKRKCHFWGIDNNAERIRQAEEIRDALGYENMEFIVGRVAGFQPPETPDMVMSLHACDTATDEALAKGIELSAPYILAVPCCQSELLNQMEAHPLASLTRHGVYAARFADLLTDGLRTLALEAAGYEVSVVEYVATDDTPKNLMLRAERRGGRNAAALQRYQEMATQYGVDPAIQRFLPWLRPRRAVTSSKPRGRERANKTSR
jgi:hypothetical protein